MEIDLQRKKHCDHCNLAFGFQEKRYEYNGMVVHEEPCLSRLKRAAEQETLRLAQIFANRRSA